MRFFIIVLFLGFGFIVNAQDINYNGVDYEIKKDRIFKDSIDVTDTLPVEEKVNIKVALDEKLAKLNEVEAAEEKMKKAEKAQKNAERKQKKAENELAKREKVQSNFDRAVKKYEDAIAKYEKLKSRGKISPVDDVKWLDKIEKYKDAIAKAKKKL